MKSEDSERRLRIGVHVVHGCTVVVPMGEIDLATRDQFRVMLARCTGDVIVDLAGLTFLDSGGIGVLVGQRNRLTDNGGSLVLRAPHSEVRLALVTVGMESWFEA